MIFVNWQPVSMCKTGCNDLGCVGHMVGTPRVIGLHQAVAGGQQMHPIRHLSLIIGQELGIQGNGGDLCNFTHAVIFAAELKRGHPHQRAGQSFKWSVGQVAGDLRAGQSRLLAASSSHSLNSATILTSSSSDKPMNGRAGIVPQGIEAPYEALPKAPLAAPNCITAA